MATALITGVCGFCGRHLADRLMHMREIKVVGVDILRPYPENLPALSDYFSADFSIPQQAADVISQVRPDWVFHLAGLFRGSPTDVYSVNLLAGIELLEAIRMHAVDARVLIVGSSAEYGLVRPQEMPVKEDFVCSPKGDYALSKYALTLAALDYANNRGLRVIVARPFNILGRGIPSSLVVGAILQRAKAALQKTKNPTVNVGNMETQRDFVAVEDVVDVYIQMVQADRWGEVFNICSGVPRTIRSVLEELLSFAPYPVRLQQDPGLFRSTDVPMMYGSSRKAHDAFGFKPKRSLTDSLRDAWESAIGEED